MPDPAAAFQAGDRVLTPGGNHAVILAPPWSMPNHCLIQVDAGTTLWILADLLERAGAAAPPAKAAKKKRKT